MKAFKLMRLRKNGTLGSLFINRKAIIPVGVWLAAESHETKGYAYRPGWHTMFFPDAPHLSKKGRIWVEVEIKNFKVFQRPECQGGFWALAQEMKIIRCLS